MNKKALSDVELNINKVNVIFKVPESFTNDFNLLFTSKLDDIHNHLNQKKKGKLSKDDLETTDRVLKHWEIIGLIPDSRDTERGWRTYSQLDQFWINTIMSLRYFGYPLEDIRKVKDYFQLFKEYVECEYPVLALFYIYAAVANDELLLIIFADNSCELVLRKSYTNFLVEGHKLKSHIQINMTHIIQFVERDNNARDSKLSYAQLTEQEKKIFQALRDEKINSATIHKKSNNNLNTLVTTQHENVKDKIVDILKVSPHGTTEIIKSDGKIVTIKTTKRTRL